MFNERKSIHQVEESNEFAPKFDQNGLIVVTTVDVSNDQILMTGYMNKEALEKTIATKEAYYFSRSHQSIWHKGATSGFVQKVREILIDDDQDALYMRVEIPKNGASCHVGYKSCFYRKIKLEDNQNNVELEDLGHKKVFDPKKVYGDAPNPTKL
ncbi:MAG: phosphoribosyl-AMP cyclohydrolase [Candidatus Pelagibacterales bacterium]|jgi:phosphoribosyl-AMP cyclohydrolase|nr:phosphoribosyl-AMP cyclohydrolase [Pelagibacteraceae bacterium]MDC3172016.1 phosphoribosyl-AMP cyclohydrolase [Pelagibacteraceae bacterium]|tara:strand:- start:1115 stop:1579 length:465 start_codon:yes stop_codon:yes gene_type:complete